MPDPSTRPPMPDALRRDVPAPKRPAFDPFKDPFNPGPEPDPGTKNPPSLEEQPDEPREKPESGLSDFDAPHAFASVLASGFGRVIAFVAICILTFGLTSACYRVSLIIDGWRTGGFGGFIGAIIHVPGSLFTAPGEWFTSLGDGILKPLGVPYLLLFVGGLILAVRSEISIVKLMLFYALFGALHAAAYFGMKNPISVILWLGVLAGYIWLYRWYWRQQIQVEEEAEPAEE